MRKRDCLRWAEALINGKYNKRKGSMSDGEPFTEPMSCCCLGVLQETLKPEGYLNDRLDGLALASEKTGLLKDRDPLIYGVRFSRINDGMRYIQKTRGITHEGLTHEQIGILLLFAIESGEYKNI